MAKGRADRQQARMRTLAVSHLNIATSHLEQAKALVKAGHAQQAINHMQKALASIEGAHDSIPLADTVGTASELSMLLGEKQGAVSSSGSSNEGDSTASEPVSVSADQS